MVPLQADAIAACLERNGVRYVLIGGLAAILHGSLFGESRSSTR
jgi:hypothetical protein